MYNYLKNSVTLKASAMEAIEKFNTIARTLATESVKHTTNKKTLNEKLEIFIKEEKTEEVKKVQSQIETLDNKWTIRNKELTTLMYGGKDENGTKIEGVCDIVTNDLYKAYSEFIKTGSTKKYRDELKNFVLTIINGTNIKDGAYNHLYNDIVQTMSSVRYNSNSQIAQGATFITTVNKRTYKKMLLGAIVDIVYNNKTLKVKKAK